MLKVLIDASIVMDDLFWLQAFGDNKVEFLTKITDPKVRRFAEINYGPWDRLDGDNPFLTNTDEKSLGAEFYPKAVNIGSRRKPCLNNQLDYFRIDSVLQRAQDKLNVV